MKYMRIFPFVLAMLFALSLCGCDSQKKPADSAGSDAAGSAEEQQAYAVGTYERKAADSAASDEPDPNAVVIDFGSKSIFKGIQIETDENGEIVCYESDGELQYKITDKRFCTYRQFRNFVKKKAGAKEVDRLSQYFGERDGELCFIIGSRNRSIRDKSQYYIDDATRMIVNVIHTEECRKKYKMAGSDIAFVRKKGVWKLDSLTIHME